MNTELDDLKNKWKDARKNIDGKPLPLESIIALANARKKSTLYFQYGNIAVLTLVMLMVTSFFYYLFPFQELLSKCGAVLMVGGLAIRILIELFSTIKSLRIDLSNPALKTTNDTLRFYSFRKKIHGPVTITIVTLYSIGFYMLTPEFSKYFSLWLMVLIDGSYLIGAAFLIWQIRKGIREEMKDLSEIVQLKTQLTIE